jgi:hypothetical protein
MANVPARTPTFSRGSAVLDYWLAHAEGLTVQPLGARVEEVVVATRAGRAEALIVRSRVTRRRKSIPAASIGAVEPSTGELMMDVPERDVRARIPHPTGEQIAAARARARRGALVARGGAGSTLAWLRPRAVRLGRTSAEAGRLAAARASRGAAWLAPRARAHARTSVAFAMRWTLAAAVIVSRGIARAGRGVGDGAAAAAERARASLESRRSP